MVFVRFDDYKHATSISPASYICHSHNAVYEKCCHNAESVD